ncbi:MFS transporter [Streptomyces sp. NPDC005538]|uniref:MFS transporter n=1 Tax=unclassified Streptomyces TaxID=2593676 RepID=UPI0033AAC12E
MSLTRTLIDIRPLRTSPVFRRLLIGRTVSVLGSFMTAVTVMYQVWDMTRSTVWTGGVGLASAVPMVVVGLFAGSWVDRGDRRRIFLFNTVAQAACSLLLAVQGFTGHVPVLGVLALIAAQSGFGAVGGPASGVFIPRLLPKDQVAAGLALNTMSFTTMMLVGPAFGGLLIGWAGIGACYLVDALTFLIAFYGAFGLPALPPEGEPSRAGLHGILDGLRFLAGHRVVRGALLTDLAATVLAMPVSLFPLINSERFGGSPRTLGLFLSAISVGGITASAFSGAVTRLGRPGVVMLLGARACSRFPVVRPGGGPCGVRCVLSACRAEVRVLVVRGLSPGAARVRAGRRGADGKPGTGPGTWGAALAAFGLMTNPWAGLGCLALAGGADACSVVSRSTIVQTHTPDALLGRVSAAEQIVGQAGPNLGNLRGGLVAGATSGATAMVTGGLLCVLAVLTVGASTPELRAADPATPTVEP